jgi:drug/metabolite transporter (DMT)-like permease
LNSPYRNHQWLAYAALTLTISGISWSAIVVRWAGISGSASAFYRVLIAAYYGLVYALGHLPATITSVGLLLQLPLTAILAAILLHEPITRAQIVGGALVLAGVYVVNRRTASGAVQE